MSKLKRTIVTYKDEEYRIQAYIESKRGKGNFIKDLLEREMLKEIKEGTYKEEIK